MTREEMRIQREIKQALEKKHLKPICKSRGFKVISGCPYRVVEGLLYTLYVSNNNENIIMQLYVKPLIIDDLFWEIFNMKEEAAKQPFSFHVVAAFVPYSLSLERFQLPINSAEETEEVLNKAFDRIEEFISEYSVKLKTVSDYKNLLSEQKVVNHLNCMLCDIAEGDYKSALDRAEERIAAKDMGNFLSVNGGGIYEYVCRYCKEKL